MILTEIARAVRILALVAGAAVITLSLVSTSIVPDWCDAPQRLASEQCGTQK